MRQENNFYLQMQAGAKAVYNGNFKSQTPFTSPKSPMEPPTITPLPTATPITPPAIENPIGDLKELCDFVRTPYEKRFEEEGHAHSKRYRYYNSLPLPDF
jgi:hypothetical protein